MFFQNLFRPSGALVFLSARYPPLKRWASALESERAQRVRVPPRRSFPPEKLKVTASWRHEVESNWK